MGKPVLTALSLQQAAQVLFQQPGSHDPFTSLAASSTIRTDFLGVGPVISDDCTIGTSHILNVVGVKIQHPAGLSLYACFSSLLRLHKLPQNVVA